MFEDNFIYMIFPISIALLYIGVRCCEARITYLKEQINPIANAVEIVNATPVISDRYVVINIG